MATVDNSSLIQEAKKNKFSPIANSVSESDVIQIWQSVSSFIEKHMRSQKGVHIPNFGTFSFMQKKLDVGGNKHLLIQRPVFQVGEKFCQTHGVKQTKYPVTGSVPVVPLNYSSLTVETNFDRDQIESCVREMLLALSRSLAANKTVEFSFPNLGRLQIRDCNVKFKFYKDFINSLDTGGKIIEFMQNRPGTADSVMTDRPATRAFSVSLPLPKISESHPILPPIPEDGVPPEPDVLTIPKDDCNGDYHSLEAELHRLSEEMGLERGDETKRSNLSSRVSCRQAVPIATATNMNFDDIQPSRANHPRQLDNTAFRNESDPCRMNETCGGSDVMDQFPPGVGINGTDLAGSEEFTQLQTKLCDDNAAPRPASNDSSTRSNLTPPQPPMLNGDRHSNKMPLTPPKVPASLSNPRVQSGNSQCGHPTSAGQELCYLCHQRRRRNQAIYFTEELKRREEEEDRLLQAYQEMKDAEYIMRDQDNMLAKRHDCQKISAFNLGASEAIRQRKNFRDPNFYRSYIFQRRPLTPSKSIKQKDLSEELDKQIAEKETSKEKLRSDETFLERLEQIQLVEDLAAQREQYLREKKDQKEMYRRALSAQLRYKPAQLPEREPNSLEPVFGKNDLNEQKMLEKRRLAQEIQDEQMQAVAAKKREAILKKIQDQKSEEETIKKTKENLIRDRANRYKRRLDNRRNLESEWFKAMEEKEQNELLDRLRVATPGGLLHEQCDKYYRCSQCQRKVANVGETNIWSDTYYIPGSRYIC